MAPRRQRKEEADRFFRCEEQARGGNVRGDSPTLSVIVPLFNQAQFVRAAIESVLQKRQSCGVAVEIVVVDDGSSDDSAAIVSAIPGPIRLFAQANRGPSAARNRGVEEAAGAFIGFIDADDLWPEGKVENQLRPMLEEPRIDVTLGRIRKLEPDNSRPECFRPSNETCYGVQLGSALFRRSVFERVGAFDETLRYSEDHDWFFRARERETSMVRVDADGLLYRVHDSSVSRDADAVRDGYGLPGVIKRSLDRRRAAGAGRAFSMEGFANIRMWRPSR